MIRCCSCDRMDHRVGIVIYPSGGSEEPIQLLQQRIFLHIRPCVLMTLDWQLNKTQMPYDFIKQKDVVDITTRQVTVFKRSQKVKIPQKKPFDITINVQII